MSALHFATMLTAIFLPILFIPLVLMLAPRLQRLVGYVALAPPFVSACLILWLAAQFGSAPQQRLSIPWIPMLGVDFALLFDGLSLFYGMIICCVGVLVCWYSAEYLGNKYKSHGRFYISLLLFMTAMLGTVFSDNLLLMFVFWECTGIASFLLIGFFHENEKSRTGARQALLVTAGTGLCMLVGIIMLGRTMGTYSISAIYAEGLPESLSNAWTNTMLIFLLLGAFGKSAQFPFHFWLPGAMAAPTPVSAYLHSATMVKLGVFLTGRLFPVFHTLPLWFWLVCSVGFFTMLLGAFLAFRSNDLKSILAFSTVSQLGFLIGVYGVGSRTGIQYDYVHILSHVFYKGSLFMVAGIVDHATGTRDVRHLGGLGRRLPVTAFAAAVGAAALAGVPLTSGFISKEILLADLGRAGNTEAFAVWFYTAIVACAATLSVAFAARIFFNVFTGRVPEQIQVSNPGLSMQMPALMLAIGALVFGVFPGGLEGLLAWLSVPGIHGEIGQLSLWHGFNLALFISLGVFSCGGMLYWWSEKTQSGWTGIPRWIRYDEAFEAGLSFLGKFAKKLTNALQADWPPMYLPIAISFLLIVLCGAIAVNPESVIKGLGGLSWTISPVRLLVALAIICALLGIIIMPLWTSQLVCLSGTGFLLAFYFVLYRAPDLAMTQILVESASIVMILLLLSRFPSSNVESQQNNRQSLGKIFRLVLSGGVGVAMFLLVIFADLYRHPDPAGTHITALSKPLASGENVVNTILVDFRGFDTLGEITVLLIATIGALGLMMRYKSDRSSKKREPIPPGFVLGKERDQK